MNISAVSHLLPSWTQFQANPSSSAARSNSTTQRSSIGQPAGSAQISPLAQFLSLLQQLQQQNPDLFKQVVSNIATALQKQAQSSGNTTQASQLNQLATEFQSSALTGLLPSVQDLQQASLGAQHHHQPFGNMLTNLLGTGAPATTS